MKLHLFIIISALFISLSSKGQEFATDKGASTISILGSFTSLGGEFVNQGKSRIKTISLVSSYNHFVAKNFFIGLGLGVSSNSQKEYSSNSLEMGPHIGIAFGGANNNTFPYFSTGIRYYSTGSTDYSYSSSTSKASGSDILLGFGILSPIRNNIGLAFEAGYNILKLKDSDQKSYSANFFSIEIGIVCLLY